MAPARLAVVALAACLAALALAEPSAASSPEDQMLGAVNHLRVQHNARPLARSGSLSRSSDVHATRMLRRNYFGHGATGGRGQGEVLAIHYGRDVRVGEVLRAWMGSGGHRQLLLDGSFRHVGVAREVGQIRGRSATVWVMRMRSR